MEIALSGVCDAAFAQLFPFQFYTSARKSLELYEKHDILVMQISGRGKYYALAIFFYEWLEVCSLFMLLFWMGNEIRERIFRYDLSEISGIR